jgi:DNA-binding MarR family transcriptional regulator
MFKRSIEVELLEGVWRIGDVAREHCSGMMQDRTDLPLAQFLVLRALVLATKTLRSTDLAQALGCSKSNVSQMIARLTQRGWIGASRQKSDARALGVGLTIRGLDRYIIGAEQLADDAARVFDPLSAEEKEQLRALLQKITFPVERAEEPPLV